MYQALGPTTAPNTPARGGDQQQQHGFEDTQRGGGSGGGVGVGAQQQSKIVKGSSGGASPAMRKGWWWWMCGGKARSDLSVERVEELHMITGFSRRELHSLRRKFLRHVADPECITRDEFASIPAVAISPLQDRLVAVFGFAPLPPPPQSAQPSSPETDDSTGGYVDMEAGGGVAAEGADGSGGGGGSANTNKALVISFRDFIETLSAFNNPTAPAEARLRAAFQLQDMDGDGELSVADLVSYMQRIIQLPEGADVDLEAVAVRIVQETCGTGGIGGGAAGARAISQADFSRVMAACDLRLYLPL